MRWATYLALLGVILLGLTFAILNANPVVLNYYVGSVSLSLSLLLVLAVGVGIFLGLLGVLKPVVTLKAENVRLRHRIKQAEQEVENLRSIPIRDAH